jgi:hypothetical protein
MRINLDRKCRKCNGDLEVRIYKNRVGGRQQGLYCSKCGKYNKFLTNDEVFYCAGENYLFKNEYGDLSDTVFKNLMYITTAKVDEVKVPPKTNASSNSVGGKMEEEKIVRQSIDAISRLDEMLEDLENEGLEKDNILTKSKELVFWLQYYAYAYFEED